MSEKKSGYILENLPIDIHAYRFYDMHNETCDAWIAHRKEYTVTITPEYLDLNILDLRGIGLPTAYALQSVTSWGQQATQNRRTKYLYAIITTPGFLYDLARVSSSAASLWRKDEPMKVFIDEQEAIHWLITTAPTIK